MKNFSTIPTLHHALSFFSSSSLIVKLISAHTIKSGKERGGKEKKREKVFFFCSPYYNRVYILLSFYFSLLSFQDHLESRKIQV